MKLRIILPLLFCVHLLHSQNTERLLKINNTSLNVNIIGSGPPIIIVHGGPGLNHTYFLPHLLPLAKTHKLVFFDQRACGKSSGDLDSTQMSLDWMVKDIEAIRQQLSLGDISVLAHSWGGLLGMKYAAEYPKHLKALILVNSVSPKAGEFDAETNQAIRKRYNPQDSARRAQILKSDAFRSGNLDAYREIFTLTFKQSFSNKQYADSLNLELPPDFLNKRKKLFYMTKELSALDLYPALKQIKCPVLIFHGSDDTIPLTLPEKIQQHIPGSKLTVINNAGHFPFIEQRQMFIKEIQKATGAITSSQINKKQ